MIRWLRLAIGIGAVAAITLVATGATAGADGRSNGAPRTLQERLTGYEEDPLALSTTGTGEFRARIGPGDKITYSLRYSALEGTVTQAHIHLGGAAQSGGISVFLCSNLGNGPAGTQACPPAPATVTGTIRPADVIGPVGQGIDPGQFAELVAAIRADTTYVNVHSTKYEGGEIRAQLEQDHHD
jgi:CHRD domain